MTAEVNRCGAATASGRPCRRQTSGGRCKQHPQPVAEMPAGSREPVPDPPDGLSPSASQLWWSVLESYELEAHELALLREACRTLSTCDELDQVMVEEGLITTGSRDQLVAHPAVGEARQYRLAFGRLVAQLRLPEGEDDGRRSTATGDGRPQRRGGARGLYAVTP